MAVLIDSSEDQIWVSFVETVDTEIYHSADAGDEEKTAEHVPALTVSLCVGSVLKVLCIDFFLTTHSYNLINIINMHLNLIKTLEASSLKLQFRDEDYFQGKRESF